MRQRYTHLSSAYKRTIVGRVQKIWSKPAQCTMTAEKVPALPSSECTVQMQESIAAASAAR
jgi:hypothetical protein